MISKVGFTHAEKLLVKFNENTKLKSGAVVLISSDKLGRNPELMVFESTIKKE